MSMDLIAKIQQDVLALPEEAGIDEDTAAVAGASMGKRLSIKGGVFRKFVGGKQTAAIEERHMEVIFVKMAHTPARNFYDQVYKEGENIAPLCWSSDTQTPDATVKNPQAKFCTECPKSVSGSGTDGQGTACRLSWRTAVVLPSDPGGDVLQLVLPSTSVFGKGEGGKFPFRAYVQFLVANKVSAGRVVTKMQFDTESATPKLLFSPARAVPPEDVQTLIEQNKSAEAELAIKIIAFNKSKERTVEGEAPQAALPPAEHISKIVSDEAMPEPVLRKSDKATAEPVQDMNAILQKWASKK